MKLREFKKHVDRLSVYAETMRVDPDVVVGGRPVAGVVADSVDDAPVAAICEAGEKRLEGAWGARPPRVSREDAIQTLYLLGFDSDMQVFEIVAPGFDAATDATDDLVLWVASPDEATARTVAEAAGFRFCGRVGHAGAQDVDVFIAKAGV